MSTTLDGSLLSVGMPVEAKFRGTAFRPGHVTNVRPDGTCDIAYIDGDMEYRVQPVMIRSQQPANAYARAGEVTGTALRKTGKQLTSFGENVIKHLLAEEEPPAPQVRPSGRSAGRGPSEERRPRGASRDEKRRHGTRGPSEERRGEGRGASMEASGARSRVQDRLKDSTRSEDARRGYSMDRPNSRIDSRERHDPIYSDRARGSRSPPRPVVRGPSGRPMLQRASPGPEDRGLSKLPRSPADGGRGGRFVDDRLPRERGERQLYLESDNGYDSRESGRGGNSRGARGQPPDAYSSLDEEDMQYRGGRDPSPRLGVSSTPKAREPVNIRKNVSKRSANSSKGGEAVTVGVRLRPVVTEAWEEEMASGWMEAFHSELDRNVLELDEEGQVCNSWSFDYVWGSEISTSSVYDDLAKRVVEQGMDGVNGTIFAYGQTAAGKTFSMFGNEQNPGIITRAVHDIFDKVRESKFSEYLIRGSYIELYNEDIRDLLAGGKDGESDPGAIDLRLKIAEDPKIGPFVKGAVERVLEKPEQVLDMIRFGEKNRHYGSTNMNDRSSRSHVMVRLVVKRGFVSQQRIGGTPGVATSGDYSSASSDNGGGGVLGGGVWHTNPKIPQRVSSLNFVDLAGSEKSKKTGASGSTLKEANAINKSLLTLGVIINKLSEDSKSQHIPYRDSKLTHLLSASLGGNAVTAMLACVSATDYNREETQSTLRYAARAKKIVNNAEMNEVDNLESFMDNYWNEVDALRRQITEAATAGESKVSEANAKAESLERKLANERAQWEDDMRELQRRREDEIREGARKLEEVERELGGRAEEADSRAQSLQAELTKAKGVGLMKANEAMERALMRVEEIELYRLEEQADFDADQARREEQIETQQQEIARMAQLLGEAPKQVEKIMNLSSEQEGRLSEKDKRITGLEQKLADMASLSSKVASEAAASREAASQAQEALAAQQETFDADVEEAAGQLLRDARARIAELEVNYESAAEERDELRIAHDESSSAHFIAAAELEETLSTAESLSANLKEESAERKRLRDENNMLRGRLRAMDKMGGAAVAAALGIDEENQQAAAKAPEKKEPPSVLEAKVEELMDRVSELEHENSSLTAISADYRDHAAEKLIKYEAQVEKLNGLLKEAQENLTLGETNRSLELRQELLALEELYTKDTTQLRVAYKELEAHHAERNIEALARMGEESPLVAELMGERDQLKDKLAGLQEEQSELMADLTKAVGKVDVQEEVINTVSDQLQELTGAVVEQGEDIRVLLEENGYLRAHIDRASRVAAAAALTRDRDKSEAWMKEVSDLGSAIQTSIADELRSAYDEVRSTHLEVVALRESLARAQEHSVVQSHRMASHLREFKGQLEAVNDVEVRLADLHDQASAVGSAQNKMAVMEKNHAEYKRSTEAKLSQLEAAARPQENIREVSLKLLPEGYILWFHSHVNPQVAALGEAQQRDNLLMPHPKAFISSVMPEGLILDIDRNVVAAELRSFPDLEEQIESLVPEPLSERQFWINYFSHKHGIKITVSEEADRMAAAAGPGSRGFIHRPGASAHLRLQFVEAMREAGVHLKLHQGTEVTEVVLWLKTPTELAWSTDLANFPPPEHFTIPFFDIASVTAGKVSEVLKRGLAQWADADCCFSFQLSEAAGGGTLDFEAPTRDETFTFIEGVHMLLKDAETNRGAPSYSATDAARSKQNTYTELSAPRGGGGGAGGGAGKLAAAGWAVAAASGMRAGGGGAPMRGGGGGGGGEVEFQQWLSSVGLDQYLPALDSIGHSSLRTLVGKPEQQIMQIAQAAGMAPNDGIKFARRLQAMGGGAPPPGGGGNGGNWNMPATRAPEPQHDYGPPPPGYSGGSDYGGNVGGYGMHGGYGGGGNGGGYNGGYGQMMPPGPQQGFPGAPQMMQQQPMMQGYSTDNVYGGENGYGGNGFGNAAGPRQGW